MIETTKRSRGPFGVRYTDGPFSFDKAIFDADGTVLISIFRDGYDNVSIHDGDWHLFAAAPEMLEVLQELDESAYYWSQYDVPVGIHDRIKSVIAKAEGRQG